MVKGGERERDKEAGQTNRWLEPTQEADEQGYLRTLKNGNLLLRFMLFVPLSYKPPPTF